MARAASGIQEAGESLSAHDSITLITQAHTEAAAMTNCHVHQSGQLNKHAQSQIMRVLLARHSTTWWDTKLSCRLFCNNIDY